MNRAEMLRRLHAGRVGRLATVTGEGRPHLVPLVYAVEDDRLYSIVDYKAKETHDLKRIRNIEADGRVSVLVDHYEEDWSRLWWVRVDGMASVVSDGPVWRTAVDALVAKYGQYRAMVPNGPVIVIQIDRLGWWSAAP